MITRAALSTVVQGQPKYRSMLAGNTAFSPTSFQSIETYTATGGETSITFSSVPTTFASLQLRGVMQRNTTNAMNWGLRFNGSSASDYSSYYLTGNGGSVTGVETELFSTLLGFQLPNNTANIQGAFIIDLFDTGATDKFKTITYYGGYDQNVVNNIIAFGTGQWISTAAITSITLYFLGDALAAGTSVALYGIAKV